MAFWNIDLTTRMGAHTATSQGAFGCFAFSVFAVLGMVFLGGMAGFDTAEGMATAIGAGLEAVVGLIAGLRMRANKGAFWGMAVAALLAIEMITKLMSFTGIGGLIINAVILVVIVNGVRGALALRRGTGFDDDDIEVFE